MKREPVCVACLTRRARRSELVEDTVLAVAVVVLVLGFGLGLLLVLGP